MIVKRLVKSFGVNMYNKNRMVSLPSALIGPGLGSEELGEEAGGPTPSSSLLLEGLLPLVKLLLLLDLLK